MEREGHFWNAKNLEFFAKELAGSDMLHNIIGELCFLQIIPERLFGPLLGDETTNTTKARKLVSFIAGIGKTGEQNRKIAEVFYKYGLQEVSDHIDSQFTSMLSTRDSNVAFNGDLRTLPNIITTSCEAGQLVPVEPPSPLSPLISDEEINYASYDDLVIKVKPAKVIFGPDKNVYKNESTPRGYVFLSNTSKFYGDAHSERIGSEIDVENLKNLFTQMGYVVEEHSNLTKGGMLKALEEFSEHERLNSVDSCIVVVMSHGSHDTGIITADNKTITEDKIVDYFNNMNCPALTGKPKIFIFQFCRGELFDVGVDLHQTPRNVSNINAVLTANSIDGISMGETQSIGRSSILSDIICVYATTRGYVAYLNKDRGSWLIQALCVVFMENAYNTDFEMLLKLVSQKLNNDFASQEGWKQQMERRLTGFDKVFYFNPQPLDSLMSSSLNSLQELGNALQQDIMMSSFNSNLSVTPPHERRHRNLELHSRSSTPELRCYDLQHSGSSGLLRSRHSSGTSVGSRDLSPFSPAVRPRHQNGKENRRFSFESFAPNKSYLKPSESEIEISNSPDEVDTRLTSIKGTAEDFKIWRLKNTPEGAEGKVPSLKRQLSAPNEAEALKNINCVETFLQVNDLDEYAEALGPIKAVINKIKRQAKKKKRELNSLDY